MEITPILDAIFAFLGVTNTAAVLATVPAVIALVAWLRARGWVLPDLVVFKWPVSGVTATTFLVAFIAGGYAQFAAGGLWYSVPAAGLLAYLAAAGVYDGVRALLRRL